MKIIKNISDSLGDMPNLKLPMPDIKFIWKTLKEYSGYKLQVNLLTNHARILDSKNFRIAWGSENVMKHKFERITRGEYLNPGDILGVKRSGGLYEHYAVYIGNNEIIHYSGHEDDFSEKPTIRKAPIKDFFNNANKFFVLDFPQEYGTPVKIHSTVPANISFSEKKAIDYHLYSPEETVLRAKSRIGEDKYSLIFNNCEHFAIWCKTGISESHQINRIINDIVTPLEVTITKNFQ